MALVVETGSGSATAESYISVADATTYHAARGNAAWAALASDTVREQLLRKSTEYMMQVYRQSWKGVRMTATQALDWPRAYVYLEPVITGANIDYPNLVASNIVPTEVKRACAELALKASSAELYADQEQTVKREKLGPLEWEYDPNSQTTKRYSAVDAMLAPYFAGSGNTMKAVRV